MTRARTARAVEGPAGPVLAQVAARAITAAIDLRLEDVRKSAPDYEGDAARRTALTAAVVRDYAAAELLRLLEPDLGARLSELAGEATTERLILAAELVLDERMRGPWAPVPGPFDGLEVSGAPVVAFAPWSIPTDCVAALVALSRLKAASAIPPEETLRRAPKGELLDLLELALGALLDSPGGRDQLELLRARDARKAGGAARQRDRKGKPRTLTPRALAEAVRLADELRRAFPARYRGAEAVAEAVLQSWAGSSDPELAAAAGLRPKYLAQRIAREVNSRKA